MLNREIQSDRKNKNIIGMMQSCLILILVVLIIMIMVQITRLQGTARVINYAGLVRGDTQRMVKLEITGSRSVLPDREEKNHHDERFYHQQYAGSE